MSKFNDLTGKRFGMVTVLSRAPNQVGLHGEQRAMWNCVCDCGNKTIHRGSHLSSGAIKSCGCYGRVALLNAIYTHRGCHTRLYGVWSNMKNRCYNPKVSGYKHYGGRGISVCQEWMNDFESFRSWAYSTGYDDSAPYMKCTIERNDVNGNYEPSNCCWATAKQQSNNRRPAALGVRNPIIRFRGEDYTLDELAHVEGITYKALRSRIARSASKYGYEKRLRCAL